MHTRNQNAIFKKNRDHVTSSINWIYNIFHFPTFSRYRPALPTIRTQNGFMKMSARIYLRIILAQPPVSSRKINSCQGKNNIPGKFLRNSSKIFAVKFGFWPRFVSRPRRRESECRKLAIVQVNSGLDRLLCGCFVKYRRPAVYHLARGTSERTQLARFIILLRDCLSAMLGIKWCTVWPALHHLIGQHEYRRRPVCVILQRGWLVNALDENNR